MNARAMDERQVGREAMRHVRITFDGRRLVRGALGVCQWRKWIGMNLIRLGCRIMRCDLNVIAIGSSLDRPTGGDS